MNSSLFLSFFELSVGLYILGSILFSIVLSNYRSYGFPTLLSSLSTFSIFILTSLLFLILNLGDSCFTSFYGLVNLSPFNCFFLILLLISTCFILILNKNYYSTHGLYQYEFDILLIFSVLGLIILCLSNDFLLVYMGIELQSLAFYVLATFKRNSEFNNEAGLKYFILGSFSSCLLLIGFSFFYLALGSTSFDILFKLSENRDTFNLVSFAFVLTMVAFFFKVGAAPFHMWICDVYEGSLLSVTSFFAIVPKTVIFYLLFKIFFVTFSSYGELWSSGFILIGLLSVGVGSITALYQKKTKRLLAYSAVGHVGFILLGISSGTVDSIKSVLIYLVIYMIMNIGIFALIIGFSKNGLSLKYLINWSFLKKWNVILALTFAILFFSVAGIPPLAGFFSKFGIILTLILQENLFTSLMLIIFSCIGCFYYIRLIKILFFGASNIHISINGFASKELEFCLALSTLVICFLLLNPNFLVNIIFYITLWLN